MKRKKTTPVHREPGSLFPEDRTPEEVTWTRDTSSQAQPPLQVSFNQQINFFGEIQGFDNLEKLSPETRSAALAYLEREQSARHQYVSVDQRHQHSIQVKGQQVSARISTLAMIVAAGVFIVTLILATILLLNGKGAAGFALILLEAATAVGMVVYGNRLERKKGNSQPPGDDPDKSESDSNEG